MDAAVKGKSSQIGRARQFLTPIKKDEKSTNSFECNLCQKQLSGNCQSNLLSHFKSVHKDVYNTKISISPEESISVQRLKLVYSCVELVAVNSQPFSLLSCSGFISAIKHKLQAFQLAGCPLNLSDHHVYEIKEKVKEIANAIKQQLKMEIKGKLVSIMVDGASRMGRSVFGINAQYKVDGVLKVATLSMCELNQSHTAVYLSDVLQEALTEYEIDLSQVISITTDNGSNMLAMVKDLENRLFEDTDEQDQNNNQNADSSIDLRDDAGTQSFSYQPDQQTENEIYEILKTNEFSDDDALNMLFDNSSAYEALLEKLVNETRERSGNHHLFMASIKCAAHTLQLAVNDALKLLGKTDVNLISLCRLVAKFLRLQSTKYEMHQAGLTSIKPRLDVETRWSSTYLMIHDVLKCQKVIEHFAKTNKMCELLLRKLDAIKEMEEVLHVVYLTTVLLQKNDFTLSDFYGCFQIIELRLKRMIGGPKPMLTKLARHLLNCMGNRKAKVIETPLMICAVFLDPRYKCTIESDYEKIQMAKITIEQIWNRMKLVKGVDSKEDEKQKSLAKKNNIEDFYAELDLHLNQTLGLHPSSTGHGLGTGTDDSNDKGSIINAISQYELAISGFRMKSSDSIHEFWENKKTEFGILYEIAAVVFAIPPTQASVERNFSALKYMLTDKRYNLKAELLESLLLIHLNRNIFAEVQKAEIEEETFNHS